jgi:hypothetical protein
MKKNKKRDEFLAQLRKIPIVQVACEKTGISRQSVYRWRTEDDQFRKEMEIAMVEGEALVNDMGESQLLSMIRDKNWPALHFWLRTRNPKFRDRVEVTTTVNSEALSLEEMEIVREANRLAAANYEEPLTPQNNESGNTPAHLGSDAQQSEDPQGDHQE